MKSDSALRLVADIGGTNARFALSEGGSDLQHIEQLTARDYPAPQDAINAYLSSHGARPTHAAFAVACAVTGDEVRLTNSPWGFSQKALKAAMGWETLAVYNDFTGMALSLPFLGNEDKRLIGGEIPSGGSRRAIGLVGPGTGLGVSGLIPIGAEGWEALQSEGGHVGFAPTNDREDEILVRLRARFGRLSAERVISGMGIENLYQAVSDIEGRSAEPLRAAEISALASEGDPVAGEVMQHFNGIFGSFAGDLVLAIGAWDGVYIGGGIPLKLGDLFDIERFNHHFEAKGRYAEAMARVPRWLITREHPALLGLAHELDRILRAS